MGKATEGMIEIATDIAEELCLMDELEEILDSEDNFYDVSDFIDEYKYEYLKMDNMKDKLIEIAKKAIASDDCIDAIMEVELDCNDLDNACEEIADSIIEKLPEILADSEWVKLPCKVGDTVWFLVYDGSFGIGIKIKQRIVNAITLNSKGVQLHSERNDFIDANVWGYVDDTVFLTKAEAEAKLVELKGAKK